MKDSSGSFWEGEWLNVPTTPLGLERKHTACLWSAPALGARASCPQSSFGRRGFGFLVQLGMSRGQEGGLAPASLRLHPRSGHLNLAQRSSLSPWSACILAGGARASCALPQSLDLHPQRGHLQMQRRHLQMQRLHLQLQRRRPQLQRRRPQLQRRHLQLQRRHLQPQNLHVQPQSLHLQLQSLHL
jgi:hypothetical protein